MSVPPPFHPPFQPGDKVPSTPHSDPIPTPVPSNPLIPPGVGTPALGGREPTATPPAVALEPCIIADRSAGQTIFHAHVHLIPRKDGEIENPRGSVATVIPNKQSY